MTSLGSSRDVGVDALRGVAVVFMIGANLVPYLLTTPYAFWFRVWTSTAAPLFVFLSGMMMGRAAASGRLRPWSHYAKRGLALLLAAVGIDAGLWGVTPFVHFDVLYLLACLQLLAPKFTTLGVRTRVALIAGVFIAAEPLRDAMGYRSPCGHVGYDILQACLVDGWFPLFPWLGLGLAATHFGAMGVDLGDRMTRRRVLVWASTFLVVGGAYLYWENPEHQLRMDYAEIFYPPTLGFMACALGGALLSVAGMRGLGALPGASALALFGRSALLIYCAHIAVIARVIHPLLSERGVGPYVAVYLGLVALMWVLSGTLRHLIPRPQGFLPRLLLG